MDFEQWRAATDDLAALGQAELFALTDQLGATERHPSELAVALSTPYYELIQEYSRASSALAVDYFLDARSDAGVSSGAAVKTHLSIPREQTDGVMRAALFGPTVESKHDRFDRAAFGELLPAILRLKRLQASTQRLIKRSGRGIVEWNAELDRHARWARVPRGAHTCAWCLMLASRGAKYWSRSTAGATPRQPRGQRHGHEYHDDCDCEPVAIWPDTPYPKGYDPEALYQLYKAQHFRGATDREVAKNMREAYDLK